MNAIRISVLFITCLCAPVATWADSITVGASKDNAIFQSATSNSGGGTGAIYAGGNNSDPGSPRRALIAFNLPVLPAGATISGVTLTLYAGQQADTTTPSIEVHRLTTDWTEGTAGTGGSFMGTGNGFNPPLGGATWNQASPGNDWGTAGGDFAGMIGSTYSATTTIGNVLNVPTTWSGAGMVSDVSNWYANVYPNYGWEIINASETVGQSVKGFYSREATDTTKRPSLTIEYSAVPEPAAVVLLALAALLAFLVRQRR